MSSSGFPELAQMFKLKPTCHRSMFRDWPGYLMGKQASRLSTCCVTDLMKSVTTEKKSSPFTYIDFLLSLKLTARLRLEHALQPETGRATGMGPLSFRLLEGGL